VKEETGYNIHIVSLFSQKTGKYTYIVRVIDGDLRLNPGDPDNVDIPDVQ
jgi:hypothetical protein